MYNDKSIWAAIIERTISEIADSEQTVKNIGNYAFAMCTELETASFPAALTIGDYAFSGCSILTAINSPSVSAIGDGAFEECSMLSEASFPETTVINSSAFRNCSALMSVNMPKTTRMGMYAFAKCSAIEKLSFPTATYIDRLAFYSCVNLISLYLLGSSVCTLAVSNAFASTPIGGYSNIAGQFGSIYVPASLISSYQSSRYWSYFSSRFVAYNG